MNDVVAKFLVTLCMVGCVQVVHENGSFLFKVIFFHSA
jgi:hypothetical protein